MDANPVPTGDASGAAHEVLERRVAELTAELDAARQELTRRALHDALTGLPNRALFVDRLAEAQANAARGGGPFCVLMLDMDDFKEINDTCGHDGGDRVLVEVAERARRCLRPTDTVARFGGDEFAILLPGADASHAEALARRLGDVLRAPVRLDDRLVIPAASIGLVAAGPDDSQVALRSADLALHAAKERKGGRYQAYQPEMHAALHDRLKLSADLRAVLARGELSVVYQPIVSARAQVAEGVEALVRWQHPERGNVPPNDFIPHAEHTGVIHEIGLWVLETASRELVAWRRSHRAAQPLNLSVNLSTRQLERPDLIGQVADVLQRTGLPPTALTLEVTESALVEHITDAVEPLERLRALGIRVSIDDFGTGYSSLNYVRRLPVDEVKIDRSFVSGIAERSEEWAFASAIVRLIKSLGLATVAEGVESGAQLAHVMALGCDLAQGYHLGRPGPLDGVESLLQAKAG